jgi:hypothetical protein
MPKLLHLKWVAVLPLTAAFFGGVGTYQCKTYKLCIKKSALIRRANFYAYVSLQSGRRK